MNCKHVRTAIHHRRFRADRLEPASRAHLDACELCRVWYQDEVLRTALASQRVPEPDPGFTDRVLAGAIAAHAARRWLPGRSIAAGLLVVLGSLITVTLGTRVQLLEGGPAETVAAPRIVQVVIKSTGRREDATVTIRLAEDLELDGYPGFRLLEWQTDLEDGRNLLALPVRAGKTGGEMWVAVSYDGSKRQEMRIEIDAG